MEIVEILSALRHCTSDLGCDTCPMRAGIEQRAFCVATLLQESKTAITELLAGIDAAKRRCAQARAERDALREKQRWIPVTERMPNTIPCNAGTEYSEAVIVWTTGNKAMIAVWDGIDFICPTDFWEAWDEEITHWMPLPEAPKFADVLQGAPETPEEGEKA